MNRRSPSGRRSNAGSWISAQIRSAAELLDVVTWSRGRALVVVKVGLVVVVEGALEASGAGGLEQAAAPARTRAARRRTGRIQGVSADPALSLSVTSPDHVSGR